jgi:phenylacetic acid degradation operon negative regulatory protein
MARPAALSALIAAHHGRVPPRTGSLIVSVFGALVLPAGEALRLSDLQEWLAALEIEPGLVRTALSRLVNDGTLLRERDGKAALYRLSARALKDFEAAGDLIFGRLLPRPTGDLDLLVIEDTGRRATLRAELGAMGFLPLASNLMIRPAWSGRAAPEIGGCLALSLHANAALALRARELWPLEHLASGYRTVIAHAEAVQAGNFTSAEARLARLMLVHEFRRIVLRDPFLPEAVLPKDWPGSPARLAFDAALQHVQG